MTSRDEELSDEMMAKSKKVTDEAKSQPAPSVPDVFETQKENLARKQAAVRKHPPTNIGGGDE